MQGILTDLSLCNATGGASATGLLLVAYNDARRLRFTGVNAHHAQAATGRRISVSGAYEHGVFNVTQFSVRK